MLNFLSIAGMVRTDCGFVVTGGEVICAPSYHMAFSHRLKDTRLVFGLK